MDEAYEFFDYISQKFGGTSDTLIKEYVNSQIASNLTSIVICIVAFALCAIGAKTMRRILENEDSTSTDDIIGTCIGVGIVIIFGVSFISLLVIIPDLISYIVSPTGAVLREVL